MKNKATPKKLFAMFLAATMVCTMLQCTFLTAFAETATIDELIASVNADGAVTPDEVDEVNRISVLYDALADQSAYTTTVSSLKTSLYTLLSEGLTTKTTEIANFNNQSTWNVMSTATEEKAVRVKYTGGTDPQVVVGPHALGKTSVSAADTALDGLEIMINNYYQFQNAPRAGFAVQFTRWAYQNSGVNYTQLTSTSRTGMLLYFDLANSQIIINSRLTSGSAINVGTLALSEEDAEKLTLDNFSHKAITIGMHATENAENPYKVVIRLSGDTTPIVANIPAEHYSYDGVTNSGKVCIGFTAGYWATPTTYPTGNVATVFDVLGYRNAKTVEPVIYAINKLNVDTVTEADAKAIYNAVDNYPTFTELDKAQLDATKLAKLEEKLIEIAKAGYTFGTISGYHAASVLKNNSTYEDDGYAHFGFAYTNTGATSTPGVRAHDETAVAVDGLKMKFGGYKDTLTTVKSKGIALQFHKASGDQDLSSSSSANGVMLYIDILNGKLIYNVIVSGTRTVETLVTDSDVIKGLHGQIFTLEINATTETGYAYEVEIKTASGDVETAKIPANDSLATVMFDANGKTYYGFARGAYLTATTGLTSPVSNEFDFFGCANTKNIKAVDALIAALPAVNAVTTNDGNVIFEAEEAYAALTDAEKALVDNAKLTAVRAKYDELFTAETAEEGYTVITDSKNLATSISVINKTWFPNNFKLTEIEGNGVNLNWIDAGKVSRMPVKTGVNLDGFSVRFNNYKLVSGTCAELSILFSRNSGNQHLNNGTPHFVVIIDAAAGTLKVSTIYSSTDTTKQSYYDIIESDLLKYENIAGAKFTVSFEEVGEMEYKVTVNVAGQSVSGIIPAQAFADVSEAGETSLYNPKNCNFAVGAWSGSTQTVDVVGFKSDATVTTAKIAGASLTVSDSISVNYKVSQGVLSANTYTNPEIDFEIAGSTITVVGEAEEGTGYYNFTYPDIAPHLMNETIKATLYAYSGETRVAMGDTKEYSIKEYCYSILEKHSEDKELCDLVVDLLRYGAASQTYAEKDTDNLVTADLTEAQKAFGTAYTAPADSLAGKVTLSGTPATKLVSWKAVALYLAEVVNLRYRFALADDVDVNTLTVQATVNGTPVTVENPEFKSAGTNMYYLYFDAFSAANLRDVIEVTVCDAEGNAVSKTATYSVADYVKSQLDSEDANLVAMLKALLCYGDSAAAYKNR